MYMHASYPNVTRASDSLEFHRSHYGPLPTNFPNPGPLSLAKRVDRRRGCGYIRAVGSLHEPCVSLATFLPETRGCRYVPFYSNHGKHVLTVSARLRNQPAHENPWIMVALHLGKN
jgi:hypothetical protein